MNRTLHIYLDSPPHLPGGVRPTDVVVDHRVDVSGGPVAVAVAEVIATGVSERVHHDAARDAYLEWIATVGDRRLRSGESLKTLLSYRDRVSLWWFLPMQVKHYVLHPLPRLFQQILWLQNRGAVTEFDEALVSCRRVRIYARSARKGALFADALKAWDGIAGSNFEVVGTNGEPHGAPSRRRFAEGAKRLAQPFAATGFKALGLWRRLSKGAPQPAETGCDVAIVTSTDEWYTPDDVAEHRYLTDVPQRLTQNGFRVAWLPLLTGADQWSDFRDVLEKRPEPTLWPEPSALSGAANLAQDGVAEVRDRFRKDRDTLVGDPALRWQGLDLSSWIVDEIDEFLRVRSFFWMQAHELILKQLDRAKPAVVLYRNEFYSLHRAVGAACTLHGTPGWSYQHGAIPRTHWVYQHDGRDIRADDDLVNGFPAPDLFLTYSDFVTQLVTANDYPRDRVVTLGSLRHDVSFDRARQTGPPERDAIRARLDLPADRPIVVICSQLKETIPRWIELVVEGLRDAEVEAHVVLKPHWNHRDIDAAHDTFGRLQWDDYRVYEGELDALLLVANINVTGTSTTAMEAAIAGIPTICAQDEQPWEPIPYVEDGLAIGVTDRASAAEAFRTMTSAQFQDGWPDRRERFLERHLNNVKEPAVDGLSRLIARAVDSSRN